MQHLELLLKLLGVVLSFIGVAAAIYNIVTARRNAQQLAKERHEADRLDGVCLLAARTQERVTGLENRLGTFEQRIEKRLDQMAGDIGKVKDLFTEYLIKHH